MLKIETVKAHCDIPCGIYDPITAQIAALSVIRMVDLMTALEKNNELEYRFFLRNRDTPLSF